MSEVQDIEMSTDAALISALTPKQVGEITLEPFSLIRQSIASALCGAIEAQFFNEIVTVWVCTLTELEALQAIENTESIKESRIKAHKWAEAQGCSLLNYKPIVDIYTRLNRELKASSNARLREASEDGQKKVESGGRPLA